MSKVLAHQVEVAAPLADCWRAFCDLPRWTHWFPWLAQVRLVDAATPPFFVGQRFELDFAIRPVNVRVHCAVHEVEPRALVRWHGRGYGVVGDHSYRFAALGPARTRVESHEKFGGPGSLLVVGPVRRRLDDGTARSLQAFAAMVEADQGQPASVGR